MKNMSLPLIIVLIFFPVAAAAEKIGDLEVEWESSTDHTLSWTNPSISKGDYTIKVIDFNWKGDAAVSVTRKGETQRGILSQGENTIFNFTKNTTYFQGVKIYPKTVSNFLPLPTNIGTYPCCPAAEITVSISKPIQKKPVLELVLSPNWDGNLGSTAVMNLQIKNTGDADFAEGNVTINISSLKPANEKELSNYALTYNPSKGTITRGWSTPLLAGSSYNITLSLKSPVPSNKSTFTISAQSYFKDYNGKVYSATASATVSLNPTISLKKLISASTILGEKTYGFSEIDTGFLPKFFGLQTVTVVNIYVQNTQSYPVKSVILNDTIMEGFRLIDNATLQWVFDINASERKEFRYEMTAQKKGTFTAPAAVAQWNEWGVSKTIFSDRPATRVYGVFVVMTKKTDKTKLKLNESFDVTLNLKNTGDFPVGINVTDILPKNATFISGTTAFSGYLYPAESASLTYILSADNTGELELPSPAVTFWKKDYAGSYGIVPAKNITVLEPSLVLPNIVMTIAPTAAETPLPKSLPDIIGGKARLLESALPVIMLIIAIILMLMLHVINRES
jgi:uncharacterized repeat protein (TIGR01451 family)